VSPTSALLSDPDKITTFLPTHLLRYRRLFHHLQTPVDPTLLLPLLLPLMLLLLLAQIKRDARFVPKVCLLYS
jgi:hypothetical protein